MIRIRAILEEDYAQFLISGHAQYADPGSDIVCAGVSTLNDLLMNVGHRMKEEGLTRNSVNQIHEDFVHIYLNLENDTIRIVVDTIAGMMAQMASQYPENVSFEVIP